MSTEEKTGLIIVDYINEIVDPKGKLSGKGYATFIEKHKTFDKLQRLLASARNKGVLIIYVKLGFSSDYKEHHEQSMLLGAAKKFNALQLGTWATEIHPKVSPLAGETVLIKHRISAFWGTPLDLILRNNNVKKILVCGVATDLAVQSAVRDAHDRDYLITVISDCCAAANDEDHEQSLGTLAKLASVKLLEEVVFSS
jgi:nicotinamidase-related amidase